MNSLDEVSYKRGVEYLYKETERVIFGDPMNISEEERQKRRNLLQPINAAYESMKKHFNEIFRRSGEGYFVHLRSVAELILKMPNPSIEMVIAALLHDAIEDTQLNFNDLRKSDTDRIAIIVQAISKNPWFEYLTRVQRQNYNLGSEFGYENKMNELEKIGKSLRDDDYLSHFDSLDAMEKHIVTIIEKHNIAEKNKKNDEEKKYITFGKNKLPNESNEDCIKRNIQELAIIAIKIKIADRIHNLSTQWIETYDKQLKNERVTPKERAKLEKEKMIEKVKSKIKETNEHLLFIALEINPEGHKMLLLEIWELEKKILNATGKVESILGE